jgi:exodeoxyribonuclease-3
MQKIISYNVNGIRAAINKGLLDWMKKVKPGILCIQETKAQPDQVDLDPFRKLGYKDYWHAAEKKGYSGVLILADRAPDNVTIGMNVADYDSEGRVIRLDFGDISFINVYIPSGTTGDIRQDFKMKFLDDFLNFLTHLREERPNLLVCGDFNIAHREIDIHNPVSNKKTSGFLPEERAWVDKFLESGFVDTFRHIHPDMVKYSWWSFRSNARSKNLGWRLDYHMVTHSLASRIKDAGIMNDAAHSDHCPVWVDLDMIT